MGDPHLIDQVLERRPEVRALTPLRRHVESELHPRILLFIDLSHGPRLPHSILEDDSTLWRFVPSFWGCRGGGGDGDFQVRCPRRRAFLTEKEPAGGRD